MQPTLNAQPPSILQLYKLNTLDPCKFFYFPYICFINFIFFRRLNETCLNHKKKLFLLRFRVGDTCLSLLRQSIFSSFDDKNFFFFLISAFHSFTINPSPEIVEDEGSNIQLSCSIESTPQASIIWEKDKLPLPQNNVKYAQVSGPGIQGSVLYIFNASINDSGIYR